MIRSLLVMISLTMMTASTGCVKLALRSSPSLLPGLTASIFEECDPVLAEEAIPADIKLMEGLLKNDPENRQILTALSLGFCGYAYLFVEDADPERASDLYLRAREYGLQALGDWGTRLKDADNKEDLAALLSEPSKKDLEALFWTTMSWSAWIHLNLDRPVALAQLGKTNALLERVLEINPGFLHGLPKILMGIHLSALPPMLGGDPEAARDFFEDALKSADRKFYLAQYAYARYYTVRTQNKTLFMKLIREIIEGDSRELGDVCLINRRTQIRAEKLRKTADDLFY